MENSLCPYFPTIICGVQRHSTRDRWVAHQNPISCTWDLTGSTTKSSRCLIHSRSKKRDSGLSHTQHRAALIVCRNNGHIPARDFQNPAAVGGQPEAFEGSAEVKFRRFPKARTSTRRFGGRRTMEELPAAVPGSLTSRD